MSDRTYGETENCAGCRYWSEMVAQSIGCCPIEALCLADAEEGRYAGSYTTAHMTCGAWKSGHHGAVDEPPDYGEEVRAMYEKEEAKTLDGLPKFEGSEPQPAVPGAHRRSREGRRDG